MLSERFSDHKVTFSTKKWELGILENFLFSFLYFNSCSMKF